MKKNETFYVLDEYEQDIENNIDALKDIENLEDRLLKLGLASKEYLQNKQSITIRVNEKDLEAMRIKASKIGVPYQTYINMLIHKDAVNGWINE